MGDEPRLKLLLDTHIWLWSLIDTRRLRGKTARLLANMQHEIWLSPVSTVEALSIHLAGRVQLSGDVTDWFVDAMRGTKEAPLTQEVALATRQFPRDCDPFDRVLAATALVFDLTLVTADHRLLELKNIRTLANH